MAKRGNLRYVLVFVLLVSASCSKSNPTLPSSSPEVLRETVGGTRPVDLIVLRDSASGLEAAVAPAEGGELSSLRVRFRGRWVELIYRARDYSPSPGWRGKAPFLWPATGRNFAPGMKPVSGLEAIGGYDWNGKQYPMPLHGFVRSAAWKVESTKADTS